MKRSIEYFFLMGLLASLQSTGTARERFGPCVQDSGWYEVRKGAHMFYWLFYNEETAHLYRDKPLVIYLYGGPGVSSTGFSNFMEVGPLFLNKSERSSSWANYVNLLFIDNPVGVGYSYIEPGENYTTTNEDIGAEMVEFLIKFFKGHNNLADAPLYLFGESYGGKMVVEIAKQLHAAIKADKLEANFKGIGLGDAWISPFDSISSWAPVLLHTGLVDQQGYERITNAVENFKKSINDPEADNITLFKDLLGFINNEAGNVNFYNYLDSIGPISKAANEESENNSTHCNSSNSTIMSGKINELMNGEVKEALKIPIDRQFINFNPCVRFALNKDFLKPVTNVVEEILTNTDLQVIVYNGQLDLIVSSIGTLRWVDQLKWPGSPMWQSAKREPFIIDGIIEGYVKSAGNLHFYWINRAGHMVPIYNPKAALELFKKVTKTDNTLTCSYNDPVLVP